MAESLRYLEIAVHYYRCTNTSGSWSFFLPTSYAEYSCIQWVYRTFGEHIDSIMNEDTKKASRQLHCSFIKRAQPQRRNELPGVTLETAFALPDSIYVCNYTHITKENISPVEPPQDTGRTRGGYISKSENTGSGIRSRPRSC